jgi:hypothetical protein
MHTLQKNWGVHSICSLAAKLLGACYFYTSAPGLAVGTLIVLVLRASASAGFAFQKLLSGVWLRNSESLNSKRNLWST